MSPNVENIHKFTLYTDYLSITKKVVMTEQSIHGNVSTHKDVLLCEEQITDLLSHWTSVWKSPNVENIHKFTQYTHFLSVTQNV